MLLRTTVESGQWLNLTWSGLVALGKWALGWLIGYWEENQRWVLSGHCSKLLCDPGPISYPLWASVVPYLHFRFYDSLCQPLLTPLPQNSGRRKEAYPRTL